MFDAFYVYILWVWIFLFPFSIISSMHNSLWFRSVSYPSIQPTRLDPHPAPSTSQPVIQPSIYPCIHPSIQPASQPAIHPSILCHAIHYSWRYRNIYVDHADGDVLSWNGLEVANRNKYGATDCWWVAWQVMRRNENGYGYARGIHYVLCLFIHKFIDQTQKYVINFFCSLFKLLFISFSFSDKIIFIYVCTWKRI